jgi:periplasmic divalent cation tolerance protein
MTDETVLLVFTNAPSPESARHIARSLVDARLAACVNILPACQSIYRWQGAVEEAAELPILIKTTAAHYQAVEAAIRLAHPYELPEIVAVPVERGLPGYLTWVATETRLVPLTPPES